MHGEALAFRIRQQFALMDALMSAWPNVEADRLVREITAFSRIRRHDAVVDAEHAAKQPRRTSSRPARWPSTSPVL